MEMTSIDLSFGKR